METTIKTKETKEKEQKFDYYMPNNNPIANKAYQLIKDIERKILYLIVFTIPDLNNRKQMNSIRDLLRHFACKQCEHLGQTTQSKLRIKIFTKDDTLSVLPDKIVLTQEWQDSKKKSMSCIGCRALRLKQIATGYIKGRRFKQVQ